MGVVVYEGPSKLDGKPIVAIITGETKRTENPKTGDMLQLWIIRSDIDPITAIKTGEDESVCGGCTHRGHADGTGKVPGRDCYVNPTFAPRAVYFAYKAGKYRKASNAELSILANGRMLRLGAYGDPMALPITVVKALASGAEGWTGYTHQWTLANALGWDYRNYLMASADTEDEAREAREMGWRTFRVRKPDGAMIEREFVCPASAEAGHKLSCNECGACNGLHSAGRNHVVIINHNKLFYQK